MISIKCTVRTIRRLFGLRLGIPYKIIHIHQGMNLKYKTLLMLRKFIHTSARSINSTNQCAVEQNFVKIKWIS